MFKFKENYQPSEGRSSTNKVNKYKTPWEMRLNIFRPITITQDEKINYWTREGNKILIGYHGRRESYGETEIGELLEPEFGSNKKTLFLMDKKNGKIIKKVLPIILKNLGEDVEIIRESEIPKKKN